MLFKILTREGKSDSRDTETNELSPTITSFYCLGERFHDTALQNKAQAETDRLPELRKYIWNVQRHQHTMSPKEIYRCSPWSIQLTTDQCLGKHLRLKIELPERINGNCFLLLM